MTYAHSDRAFPEKLWEQKKKNCAVPIRCGAHTICGTKNGEYVLSARRAYQEAARHFLITANSVSTVTNHPKKTGEKTYGLLERGDRRFLFPCLAN